MNRLLIPGLMLLLAATASCRTYEIHQGNVLKEDRIYSIHKGDSRFQVETLLGLPALQDPLHPNRVRYVEFEKYSKSEADKKRVIEITYDNALRVEKIDYIGFDDRESK